MENKNTLKLKIKNLYEKGVIHIFIGTFLTRFVSLFSSIILVRFFSKNDYGVLSFIENIYGYLFIFAGYGLAKSLVRYIVVAKDMDEKNALFRYALKNGSLFNLALIIVGCIFGFFYIRTTSFSDYIFLAMICFIQIQFNYLINCVLYTQRALFKTKRFAWFSLSVSVLIIVVKLLGGMLNGVTGAIVLLTIIEGVISVALVIFELKTSFKDANKVKSSLIKSMNFFAFQSMLVDGLWSVFILNDAFMIGKLINDATILADYKVACVLPAQLSIIATAIGMYFEPIFTKKYQEKDYKWISKNWIKTMAITFILVLVAGVFIILLCKPLILIIYGEKYLNILDLMRLLCIAYIINAGLRFTTANILSAIGKIKYNFIISLIGIGIQVGLNFIFLPKYGVYGAAYTNIIVYSILALSVNLVFLLICLRNRGDNHEEI